MIRTFREFFYARIVAEESGEIPPERALQLATAALLIELSRADFEVADEERQAIEEALRDSFGLSSEATRELVSLAERQVQESVSLYEFTHLVDQSFSPEQKKHIVGLLWRIAYSDDRLEEREEYLVRKIAKLLHVPHEDFIDEKLKAKKARG